MDAADTPDVLAEVARLRMVARAASKPSSVPLLVLGTATVLSAPFAVTGTLSWWHLLYWLVAGPLCFLVIGGWYRRQRLLVGVGSGRGSYPGTALLVLIGLILAGPLWLVQLPVIALGLLVIACLQRNAYLGVCAVLFGVAGFLEEISFFDNRLYDLAHRLGWFKSSDGYFAWAPVIVYALMGLALIAAGWVARKREAVSDGRSS